jgi:hypothetical protein
MSEVRRSREALAAAAMRNKAELATGYGFSVGDTVELSDYGRSQFPRMAHNFANGVAKVSGISSTDEMLRLEFYGHGRDGMPIIRTQWWAPVHWQRVAKP